jgi:hypothetical protein
MTTKDGGRQLGRRFSSAEMSYAGNASREALNNWVAELTSQNANNAPAPPSQLKLPDNHYSAFSIGPAAFALIFHGERTQPSWQPLV